MGNGGSCRWDGCWAAAARDRQSPAATTDVRKCRRGNPTAARSLGRSLVQRPDGSSSLVSRGRQVHLQGSAVRRDAPAGSARTSCATTGGRSVASSGSSRKRWRPGGRSSSTTPIRPWRSARASSKPRAPRARGWSGTPSTVRWPRARRGTRHVPTRRGSPTWGSSPPAQRFVRPSRREGFQELWTVHTLPELRFELARYEEVPDEPR